MTIFKLFLEAEQLQQVSIQIRGRKLMEHLTQRCKMQGIASRKTVFDALDPETYRPTSNKHRGVVETAIEMLLEHGHEFDFSKEHEPVLAEA